MSKKCTVCGSTKNLKRGWTNSWYCCEDHERESVSDLMRSKPGAGPLPHYNWVPRHIAEQIEWRWRE